MTSTAHYRYRNSISGLLLFCWTLCAQGAVPQFETVMALGKGEGVATGVSIDPSGNLYGYTIGGGEHQIQTLYKLDAAGKFSLLWDFDTPGQGASSRPVYNPVDGNLYGVLEGRRIYRLSMNGQLTIIYSKDGPDSDVGSVTVGADGNLYGYTIAGGAFGVGALFRVDRAGNYTLLHSFNRLDGEAPSSVGALVLAPDGSLLGVAAGGALRYGTIFRLTLSTNGDPAVTVVHYFDGVDGVGEATAISVGADGSVYGTARYSPPGGNGRSGSAVFKVDSQERYTLLHVVEGTYFNSHSVVLPDGTFYGSAYASGAVPGYLFKIDPTGSFSIVHPQTSADEVVGSLTQAADGSIYGSTRGYIFKVTVDNTFSVLRRFTVPLGASPSSGLTLGGDGALYGVTGQGGKFGHGVIYRVDSTNVYRVVHDFESSDVWSPAGPLVFDPGSNSFFGTTPGRGAFGATGAGTVYQFGPGNAFRVLHRFDGTTAAGPLGALAVGPNGICGTTSAGGRFYGGVAYCLNTAGGIQILHEFGERDANEVGLTPSSGLIRTADGVLQGAAKLASPNFNRAALMYRLTDGGEFSVGPALTDTLIKGEPLLEADGGFYLVTQKTAAPFINAIQKIDADGRITLLREIPGTATPPIGGVIRGPDGSLYGVTGDGQGISAGPFDHGTVYRLAPDGQFDVLHDFYKSNQEGRPVGLGLMLDGNLYGTTATSGGGTVYRVRFGKSEPTPPTITGADDQTVEATSPNGAIVTYAPTAITSGGAAVPVACSVSSGTRFPLGQTTVDCTASTAGTSATASFTVTVHDTTPPVLSLPTAIVSMTPVVRFTVTATDLVTTTLTVLCDPASGSLFPGGPTTVTCSASDAAGNKASGGFVVTVTAIQDGKSTAKDDVYGDRRKPLFANKEREQTLEIKASRGVLANDLPRNDKGRRAILVQGPIRLTGKGGASLSLKLEADGGFTFGITVPKSAKTGSERQAAKRGTFEFRYAMLYKGARTKPANVQIILN